MLLWTTSVISVGYLAMNFQAKADNFKIILNVIKYLSTESI